MCGRFTKKYTWAEIHRMYSLLRPAAIPNFQPSYNVCPTDPVDMVVAGENGRELVSNVRWALVPYWWQKSLKDSMKLASFNARVETVTTKPFFREPFKTKRCLTPVSGYYEWQDTPGGKQPWYFTARDGSPLLTVAGLWDEWKNRETGERIKSCAMIITEPRFCRRGSRPYAGPVAARTIRSLARRRRGRRRVEARTEWLPTALGGIEARE
jgi:putative SOS response-associated peptidase YedK